MVPRILFVATLFLASVFAQNAETALAAPSTEDVVKALTACVSGDAVHFTGSVRRNESKSDNPMMGMMMGPGMGGPAVAKFQGDVSVARTGKDVTIASKEPLPGLSALVRGERRIVRTTTNGKPLDVRTAVGDVSDLLHAKRLLRTVEGAEWKVARSEDGSASATTKLAGSLISPEADEDEGEDEGPMGGMNPFAQGKSVEHVLLTVELDAANAVRKLSFHVVRFDPAKAMMHRIMDQAMNGGGGGEEGVAVDLDALRGDGEKKESDMDADVYDLTPAKADAKLAKLHEELAALIK